MCTFVVSLSTISFTFSFRPFSLDYNEEYNPNGSGYFPGFGLPDFSSSSRNQYRPPGYAGHVSIVSSPFLANSKSPQAPHLLEGKIIEPPKRKKSQKKQVVINIINGPGSNKSFNFDHIINNNKENNRKMGLEGILQPMNELFNPPNRLGSFKRRKRRSSDSSGAKNESKTIATNNNTAIEDELTIKVNATGRNNLDDDDDYNYIYYSPPETFQNILNVNSFDYEDAEDYDNYSDQPYNLEAVDPSQLLIGFGGSRSTTRIPFLKAPQIQTNQHLGSNRKDVNNLSNTDQNRKPVFQNQQQNDVFNLGNIETSDQDILFGDFSNLINLNKNTLKESTVNSPSRPSFDNRDSYNPNPISSGRPSLQMIIRPPSSSSSSSAISPIRQNNYVPPPSRKKQSTIKTNQELNEYSQYDYDEYFNFDPTDNEQSSVNRPSNGQNSQTFTNQPSNNNRYPNYPSSSQYPQFPQYPQYPPYNYAPRYPYPYQPAVASTSTTCGSSGCAAAASAASGGSSSSSTSTSSNGGRGSSSASASNGYGGASTSTSNSGRSSLTSIKAEEESLDSWNSFEPISRTDISKYVGESYINKVVESGENTKVLPVPGIIQPQLERKRRSAQQDQPSVSMMSRLTDFINDDLDNLQDTLETSNNPMIVYMNNRVDTVMDGVHHAMDHPGEEKRS